MNNYFYALFLLFLASPQLIGKVKIEKFVFEKMPIIGKYSDKNISLGGFSGLVFLEKKNNGNLIFLTHTDRGPNGEIIKDKNGQKFRPFFLPEFQPEIIKFEVNTKSKKITILNRIKLFHNNMKPITGLPNLFGKNLKDEYPVDGSGKKLYFDPIGGDFEGISFSKNGEYFLVDEYRPSIFHFNEKGLLISFWRERRQKLS